MFAPRMGKDDSHTTHETGSLSDRLAASVPVDHHELPGDRRRGDAPGVSQRCRVIFDHARNRHPAFERGLTEIEARVEMAEILQQTRQFRKLEIEPGHSEMTPSRLGGLDDNLCLRFFHPGFSG